MLIRIQFIPFYVFVANVKALISYWAESILTMAK